MVFIIQGYTQYDLCIDRATAATPREARRVAAQMLGRRSLRGATTWERYQGGTLYRFGPRGERAPYVVISAPAEAEAEAEARALARAEYDV